MLCVDDNARPISTRRTSKRNVSLLISEAVIIIRERKGEKRRAHLSFHLFHFSREKRAQKRRRSGEALKRGKENSRYIERIIKRGGDRSRKLSERFEAFKRLLTSDHRHRIPSRRPTTSVSESLAEFTLEDLHLYLEYRIVETDDSSNSYIRIYESVYGWDVEEDARRNLTRFSTVFILKAKKILDFGERNEFEGRFDRIV